MSNRVAGVPSALLLVVALVTQWGASFVYAVPLATSTASTGCGRTASENRTTIGPVTVAVDSGCNVEGIGYQATSKFTSDFGPGIPVVGAVAAQAETSSTGPGHLIPGTNQAGADAGGSLIYYFTVEEIRSPPVTIVPLVFFAAHGEGTFQGSTDAPSDVGYTGIAGVAATLFGVTVTQWSIGHDGPEAWSDQFNNAVYLDLPPNSPVGNPFYMVEIRAGCSASSWAGDDFESRAFCSASVDPTIRFGQEEFDARYGDDSFQLADYYRLQFSQNVAISEPGILHLLGASAVGLLGWVGRRRIGLSKASDSACVEGFPSSTKP